MNSRETTSMTRREFVKTVSVAGLTAVAFPYIGRSETFGKDKPNILFIMTDQQHWGMMSCTGNHRLRTPNMDSIAQVGMRFNRAVTTNPVCLPCRFSLQTGLMPSDVGIWDNGYSKPKTEPQLTDELISRTISPLLTGVGYKTYYGGKVHLPFDLKRCGYDFFCYKRYLELAESSANVLKKHQNGPFMMFASFDNPHNICFKILADFNFPNYEKSSEFERVELLSRQVPTDPAERSAWITAHCSPLPENFEIPEPEPEAAIPKAKGIHHFWLLARQKYTEEDWRLYRWYYARLTEMVDKEIGILLNGLHESGHADNTVVIFTSDHGDMDACHRLGSKYVLYEESVRIPFLISSPGRIQPGQVDDNHWVSNGLDLLPTLCDYAGIAAPKGLRGRSVRPIAEGQTVRDWREFVVSETAWGSGHMVRTATQKYCDYPMPGASCNAQFFDLAVDPGETKNCIDDLRYAEAVARHRKFLAQWKEGKS